MPPAAGVTDRIERAHRADARTGVVLMNLGTPSAPTPAAIRRYLRQFLSDRRVVELPRALWLPILHLFILPLRPRRLAHAYASIWSDAGSPLLAISKRQVQGLQTRLSERCGFSVPVALAMTYGDPDIPSALAALESQSVRRLLAVPLFPQYSGSTTGAAIDALFRALTGKRWLPELRALNSYHDHPAYIAALAASVRQHRGNHGGGDHLLLSFHGVPQNYVLAGDPYYCHCQKTARLLAQALELPPDRWSVSFQSRFGKAPWVQPYTDARIVELARSGVRTLDVVCPGFSADCLETLEEVDQRYRAAFVDAGGQDFRYIPALNDQPGHLDALAEIVAEPLRNWRRAGDDRGLSQRLRQVDVLRQRFFRS